MQGAVEREEKTAVFHWKVKAFSSLDDRVISLCYSPHFHFCGRRWRLILSPNDPEGNPSEDFIQLFLGIYDVNPPIKCRYSLGIRTAKGGTEVCESGVKIFDRNFSFAPVRAIKRSELLRRRYELLPQDVLTVIVTMKVQEDGTYETCPEKMVEDIGKLWPNGDHTDVIIKVKDEEFKAHRAILAARTPVLGAMFQHDTIEKASGVVTIKDCEPKIFEQFLYYIYRGAPRELSAENAPALYVLADKYLLDELKTLCVQCMGDTLCLDTCCDTLTLSLMYREDELLKTATDFLSENMIDVMKNVQWQKFVVEHPTWAHEIHIPAMKLIQAMYEN